MLPSSYHDEILYSVIARLGDHMDLRDAPSLNQFVFGLLRVRPTIEFPPRLDALIPRLLPGSSYTATTLVGDHSLFPYFSSFLDEKRARSAFNHVVAAQAVPAFSELCITSIQNHLRLRFCQECVHLDRSEGREPYWRRVHQMPTCVVCPDHGCMLREGISVRGSETVGFVSISRMLAEIPATQAIGADAPINLLLRLARSSRVLLHRRDPLRGADLMPVFFERLRVLGWTHGQRVASTKLMKHVRTRLGPNILARIGVNHSLYNSTTDPAAHGSSTDWLGRCFRIRERVRHPLPYLLTLASLDQDASDLLADAYAEPVPTTPQLFDRPCGNVVCPDYDPPVPRPLPSASGEGMFVVQCPTCGFTYRQSTLASVVNQKRIVDFGPIWDEALRRECEKGDANKHKLECRLGASTVTIKRRAIEVGVWHPRWGDQTRSYVEAIIDSKWEAKRERSRKEYRGKWLKLVEAHPEEGRRALGRLDEVTYAFLRSYDRAWLDKTTPFIPRGSGGGSAPAADRDAKLAALISVAADVIAGLAEPTWITRQAIARELGKAALKLNPDRMPLSVAALARCTETLAAFLKRRARMERADDVMEEDEAGWLSGSLEGEKR